MDRNQAMEKYVLAKTSIQMTKATLEESKIRKKVPISSSDKLFNDLNFSFKTEKREENKITSYMKTLINSHKGDGTTVMEIEVIFRGIFEMKEGAGLDESEFNKFVEIQTVPQLLPYARSFISSVTVLMGIKPMTLPTMDIIQSLIENTNHFVEEE